MARLPTADELKKNASNSVFVQEKTLAVYFGMSHYEKVLKSNSEGALVPAMLNIE